jgi:S-DNA-T family DNA segregation ATPase FtsK/SpoIIIE
MNAIITSILYKATPDEVKMILIDPKKVELNIYNGIPHLLVPVVSDPKKAAGALSWAVNEMENRYMLIEEKGVRNFKAYNESIEGDPFAQPLPQIVIIIDELADLMLTAPADVEQSVNRLAAKARAAGLHLIVGTQRPSVDVITGLIKANIPTRIAFTVVSQIDSRTIINMAGAEKLIGIGDMLYVPTGTKPIRVQGAFISDKDTLNVIEFWKKQSDGQYDENILNEIEQEAARCNTKGAKIKDKDDDDLSADDEFKKDGMLKSAIELAIDMGTISTSMLQRKLGLGYGRAGRIVDTMERMNVIGPFEGSKPRRVLISRQEFIEMTMNSDGFE